MKEAWVNCPHCDIHLLYEYEEGEMWPEKTIKPASLRKELRKAMRDPVACPACYKFYYYAWNSESFMAAVDKEMSDD